MLTIQMSEDGGFVTARFDDQEIRIPLSDRIRRHAAAGLLTLNVAGSAQEGAVITFGPPQTVDLGGKFTGPSTTGYNQCIVSIPAQAGVPVSTALVADFNVDVDRFGNHLITVSKIRAPK